MISPPPQSLRVQEERTGKERTEKKKKKQNSPSERTDNEPIHRCCCRRLSSSNTERERERERGREGGRDVKKGEMDDEERESPPAVASDRPGQQHLSPDEDSEGDASRQETLNDDEPALPPDLEWLEELSEEDDADGDRDVEVAADSGKKRTCAATSRMFKLRRNLDQLDCFYQQKEHDMLKAREELKLCRQNIESLVEHRDNLEEEIERQKAADNSVAVIRLRGQHKHLCQKLQSEEELEGHINTELKQQELELCEMEVELGRLSPLRQEVQKEVRLFQVLKAQKAATRLQQERTANQNQQLKMQHLRE
ncbi:Cilia- and flagella-associated protein 74 [Collichthys lucidus]|uniref:Cilia-and flagella-associated protein 74 n=1 Tax=Collichthys lucidus TaxID=240159 RepID=A0A4U5UQU4_COLLU|nr:Cilia- and flagella-associated protein 74 [Collichthys lucidus]